MKYNAFPDKHAFNLFLLTNYITWSFDKFQPKTCPKWCRYNFSARLWVVERLSCNSRYAVFMTKETNLLSQLTNNIIFWQIKWITKSSGYFSLQLNQARARSAWLACHVGPGPRAWWERISAGWTGFLDKTYATWT